MVGRARKLPRFAWRRSVRALNGALGRIETRRSKEGDEPLEHPAIFVVGAPRSGSTLLYQLLVVHFDVAFLSNLHCRVFGAPSLVERTVGRRLRPPADFSSRFGSTRGLSAPSECGPYWYRFFRKSPQHVFLADAEPERLRRLRASVRALGGASGRTVVFKNLLNSLRLAPIGAALPEALFLVVRRDLEDNAASILAARRALHGDEGGWWSAEPPDVERLRALPAQEQAVEQVRAIEAFVDTARDDLGAERFLDIRYEDLCADTHGTLEAIAAFAKTHGARLPVRSRVPERFEPGGGSRLLEA